MRRALLSVSNKEGLLQLGQGLVACGFELVSTGGTASALEKAGIPVRKVAEVTGAPEILGGRVKTLHPRIHGGLLARLDHDSDRRELKEQGIDPIELLVVNLYPFRETVARGAPFEECVEEIDVGGPAMIRAAAKNSAHVAVVVDPSDYDRVLTELKKGPIPQALRRELMEKAFAATAAYDAAIASWLSPGFLALTAGEGRPLRYGENPHQGAVFYRFPEKPSEPTVSFAEVLGGKELSYNNLLDLEAALSCLKEFDAPTAVVVKHNNPCGVATASTLAQAFRLARDVDPTSAFGGIVAVNRPVDRSAAEAFRELFLECIIGPSFDDGAREALADKKNLRLLADPLLGQQRSTWKRGGKEVRSLVGGLLVQDRDLGEVGPGDLKVVTRRTPEPKELAAALFAFKVCKHCRSNAIVFATEDRVLSIGAGQTSRVDAVKLARLKSRVALTGSAVASDAFFPFRDGLDEAAEAGARCVIQPGGSVRDPEVIAAADEHGMAMVFTGMRHFRH